MTEKSTYEELDQELQALKKIVSAKNSLEHIYHAIGQSVMILDPDHTILSVNLATEKITGIAANDLKGKKCYQIFHDPNSTSPPKSCPTQKVLTTGNVETKEMEVETLGESFIVSCTPIFDKNSKLKKIIHIATDITEKKKAEKVLIESESKFRLLADYTLDWEYWVSSDGKFIYSSPSCEQITGYSPEEFISDPQLVHKIVKPEYAEKVHHHYFDESKQDAPVFSMEFPIIGKNGEEVWLEHNCNPVYDDQGNYAGRRGNNRNITDRKRTEKELYESEEKFRILYNNSPDMYVSVSPDDASMLLCNKTVLKKTGYLRKEIIGFPVFKMYHDDCLEDVKKTFQQFVETGVIQDKELILKRKDGSKLDVSLNVDSVKDETGKILYSISSWRDITDRKRMEKEKALLEKQFQQAQKMESVGRLAGGVAHDFNNALSVIMSTAELAIDGVNPTGQLSEDLDEILMAGKRAADITRQLLAFARKQTISPKVLDLNENVGDMLKMLRRLIGEDIDLAWLPSVNPWLVKVDPTQIDQILANLCVNARDAIEGVGKVTIELKNITFTEDYCADHIGFIPGGFLQLSVSDNGCGMNKEILDNIFEPFFTTKDVDKGTGLGLATVYGIVKQNNGFINVYSEPDNGTTIKVYLPRHETSAVEIHVESTEEIPTSQGETVLVVEDDPAILKIMQKILEGLGYTVLTLNAPEKVMDMVKEHTGEIHLLITDVIMPKMNGRDLAEQLQPVCPDLKCIFMSGYTADAIAHQGVLDKEVNFIQKPFSRRDLAEIVRKVLDKN